MKSSHSWLRPLLAATLGMLLGACGGGSSGEPEGSRARSDNGDAFLDGNWYPDRHVLNIAHRGGALEFPENTLYAYQQSLAVAGAHMLEMDVYETADGELVVIHDPTVERTTNGSGTVSSFTLAELKALDAAHCYVPGRGSDCSGDGPFPYRGMAIGAKAPPGSPPTTFAFPACAKSSRPSRVPCSASSSPAPATTSRSSRRCWPNTAARTT